MARTRREPRAGSGFDDLGAGVRITYLGHAGLRIDTAHGSILCDPWTNPCYFDSWFVFPDNSGLDWDRLGRTDYLYVSHLHQDHFDPVLLRDHVSHAATVLLPDFPVPDLRERLQRLGFTRFLTVPTGQAVKVGGLRLMIEALKSPADGPLGDSALAVSDGTATVLNQNDARPIDLEPLLAFGPFDVHFLQFSGAIWWPWTYELPTAAQRSFGAAKRANGLDRALRYVKSISARHVVPSAGPPCFLDDELFALNDLTGDEANTFPDQTVFTEYLSERGADARLMVPGAVLDVGAGHCEVTWPDGEAQALAPFRDKERYLRAYARRVRPRIEADKRRWPVPGVDVLAELKAWFEPVLELADHIRAGVGGPVLLRLPAGDGEEQIVIDFPAGQVRRYAGESCRYEFTIARPLIERLIADHQVDWVNSLFLSMRFRARRIGQYNEYIYTFFKCLAPERIMYAEGWYASRQHDEEDIQLGDWIVQRRCPHLRSDLSRFGVVDGTVLTCTMHGWKYDLTTGRCLTHDTAEHHLRSQPARAREHRPAAQGSLPVPPHRGCGVLAQRLLGGAGGNRAGGERLDGGPRVEQQVQACRHRPADQRRDDEQPHLAQRGPAHDEGRTEAASRIHRRAGDRDADEVHDRQREADDDSRGGGVGGLARGAENGEDEQGRHHDLDQEGASRVDVDMAEGAIPICPQPLDRGAVDRRAVERAPQQQGSEYAADDLGDPVSDGFRRRDPACQPRADGDGRVDVAPGDGTEHVGQCEQHQAERQGSDDHPRGETEPRPAEPERQGGGADGEVHQDRSSQ